MEKSDLTILGETTFRNERKRFGIRQSDRMFHTSILGRTGVGKSTLLLSMIRQDLEAGRGLALFDPHGDLYEAAKAAVPRSRKGEVIDFDVSDPALTLGVNPLEQVSLARLSLASSGVIDVMKKLWAEFWGPRLEHLLRNAVLALLTREGSTFEDIPALFHDEDLREAVAKGCPLPTVRRFWLQEFPSYPARLRAEATAPIENKVGAFLSDPVVSRILTVKHSSFRFREVMDQGKILLLNLPKGKLGEGPASLLGALLLSRIALAGLSRADLPAEDRVPFFVYLDEFQSFTTPFLSSMLSELRKFQVGLILANQFLGQVEETIREALLANVGTLVVFRVGASDAELLRTEFGPEFSPEDLVSIPNRQMALRLMIGGAVSRPFSGETIQLSFPSATRREESSLRASGD